MVKIRGKQRRQGSPAAWETRQWANHPLRHETTRQNAGDFAPLLRGQLVAALRADGYPAGDAGVASALLAQHRGRLVATLSVALRPDGVDQYLARRQEGFCRIAPRQADQ